MADHVGQQFGNYRLVSLLGQGGYAEVYLGQHTRLDLQAAIKILHAHLSDKEAEHFQQEAQIIARLAHPSIVRVFDYDVQDGMPFLVMDYAPFGSLRQRHPAGEMVPLSLIVSYVKQVAEALQYAHDHKLVHRDVKPQNMLLGRREEVLLSDFGIATVAHSTASLGVESAVGTINYMAPEQIGGHPRPASDQYALGVVVYEWLCGQRLFEGSFTELVAQHLWQTPPPLQKRVAVVSPEVEQVVLRALAKDPKQRFATVQTFAEALQQASSHTPTSVGLLSSNPSLPLPLAGEETIPQSNASLPIEAISPTRPAVGTSDLASSANRTEPIAELITPQKPTTEETLAVSRSGAPMAAPQSQEKAIHDPAIPLFAAEGAELVGRDDLLHRLKEYLCRGRGVSLTALGGLPGVGKTTLAANVAQDPEILDHFSDGVLWAGLGAHPDVLSHLSRWGMLLGLPAIEATKLSTVEEWITALRLAIGTRRLLLVIDDAWTIEAALAFQVGGPRCAYLMTTRFPPIALQFASDDAIIVPELAEEDGITLLARFAPEVVAGDPVNARSLVQAVGCLPLALTIMGKYLRKEAYSRQPRRIRAALERLHDAQERLRLTTPHAVSASTPSLPLDAPISLQTVIEVGVRGLDEQVRGALYALSVFPAKPNSFTEEAAAAVSSGPIEVLDILTDAGLLEGSEYGRYTMHQTIADYAQAHLQDVGAFGRFVEYMSQYVVSYTKDYEVLQQESSNIFAALQAASREEQFASLIRCMNAFAPFLLARGLFSLAEEYLLQVEQAARSLQVYTGLATALLHLGRIQYSHGDYSKAEMTLQEGLTLARQHEEPERLCRVLHALGTVARYRGAYSQAEAYHQEGLALARQLGDPELISMMLQGLGIDFGESGHYTQEEACYQEGAALARQVGDHERLCELLLNLGQAVYAQGNYMQALSYSEQALELCRRIGYRHAMTTLLANLGGMAVEQKNYVQAEVYLKEALEIARQMEHRNLIGVSLVNMGGMATEQGNYAQAEAYLQEALEIAHQIGRPWLLCGALHARGDLALKRQEIEKAEEAFHELREIASEDNQEYRAVALYGLARVALAHQDLREARELGQESLRLLEMIGNRQAPEVRDWLQTLSL